MKGSYLHIYNFFTDIIYSLIIVWFKEKNSPILIVSFVMISQYTKLTQIVLKKKQRIKILRKNTFWITGRTCGWSLHARESWGGEVGAKRE